MEQKRKFVNEIGQSTRGVQGESHHHQRASLSKTSSGGMGCWQSPPNDRVN